MRAARREWLALAEPSQGQAHMRLPIRQSPTRERGDEPDYATDPAD
jgi:hypothetical protein